jgi:phosphate starvation-inducible protein PhoH
MQTDLIRNKELNIHQFISVIETMESWFDVTEFGVDDIVRSGLVKDYIITKYKKYVEGY